MMCFSTESVHSFQRKLINLVRPVAAAVLSVAWVRPVPASTHFNAPAVPHVMPTVAPTTGVVPARLPLVGFVIAHWCEAMLAACIVDVVGVHGSRHLDASHFPATEVELAIFSKEVGISLGTNCVDVGLPSERPPGIAHGAHVGPGTAFSCIHESIVKLVGKFVMFGLVPISQMPIVVEVDALTIIPVSVFTNWLEAFLSTRRCDGIAIHLGCDLHTLQQVTIVLKLLAARRDGRVCAQSVTIFVL